LHAPHARPPARPPALALADVRSESSVASRNWGSPLTFRPCSLCRLHRSQLAPTGHGQASGTVVSVSPTEPRRCVASYYRRWATQIGPCTSTSHARVLQCMYAVKWVGQVRDRPAPRPKQAKKKKNSGAGITRLYATSTSHAAREWGAMPSGECLGSGLPGRASAWRSDEAAGVGVG
jgi:hypothetical protein